MDDKTTLASADAHKQFHNTEHKIMPTTMTTNLNDGQRAAIVAALHERVSNVTDTKVASREVLNQVVSATPTIELFAGYGWKSSMTDRRSKLTVKYLHDRQYMYREDGETMIGEEASIAPLDNEFYSWVASFFGPLLSEHGDNHHQRDATFIGLLTALSAVMPHCFVTDKGKDLGTSLITFISGLTGDGKGDVTRPRELLEGLDALLQQQRKEAMKQYGKEYALYKRKEEELMKRCKGDGTEQSLAAEEQYMALEEPVKPISPIVLGPVDTTLARLVVDMELNGEYSLLQVEQEMSMALQANSQEHGGSLKLLYKSFGEESYDKAIKTNMERQYIPRPRLAYLATMTHEQMPEFLSTLGGGLPSRCCILSLPEKYSEYIPEEYGTEALEKRKKLIAAMQQIVIDLYLTLEAKAAEGMKFTLTFTREQHDQLNGFIEEMENIIKAMYDDRDGLVSVARRARIICKRLLLILLVFRRFDVYGSWDKVFESQQMVPSDTDVDHVIYLTYHLCESTLNALHYYNIIKPRIGDNDKPQRMGKKEVLSSMPKVFTWAELKHLACDQHKYAARNLEDDRWIGAWIKAGLIAVVSGEGHERTFRKLTKRERVAFGKKSQKAKQRAVNKHLKRK